MKKWEKNILVVDDHALFRKMLSKTLIQLGLYDNVYEACDGVEAIENCKSKSISIMLLDINMPNLNGIDTAKLIMKMNLSVRPYVIMLTIYNEPQLVLHLLEIGVHGYLGKNCEVEDLVSAINIVLNGNLFYPKEYEDKIKIAIQKKHVSFKEISNEEMNLLEHLSNGKTNKEIASILGYSVRTIESKRIRLERKAGVKNTPELITYVSNWSFEDVVCNWKKQRKG